MALPPTAFILPTSICQAKGVKGNDVNMSDSTCPCSAVTTLDHHLTNVWVPPEAPLLAFEMADRLWVPLK